MWLECQLVVKDTSQVLTNYNKFDFIALESYNTSLRFDEQTFVFVKRINLVYLHLKVIEVYIERE